MHNVNNDPFLRLCRDATRKSFSACTSVLPLCVTANSQLRINESLRLSNNPDLENIGKGCVADQWRSIKERLLHARSMIALAGAKKTVNVMLPADEIPLTLFGDEVSVGFAVANLVEVIEKPLFASLNRRWPSGDAGFNKEARYWNDPLSYHELGNSRVAAILPIPGPLAGWDHYDGWLAFIGTDVLHRSPVCKEALEAWLDASIGWKKARGDEMKSLDRALATRSSAKYQQSRRIGT